MNQELFEVMLIHLEELASENGRLKNVAEMKKIREIDELKKQVHGLNTTIGHLESQIKAANADLAKQIKMRESLEKQCDLFMTQLEEKERSIDFACSQLAEKDLKIKTYLNEINGLKNQCGVHVKIERGEK